MKIAFFTDTYEPQINGVVTAIKLFARHLRKKGHGVDVFCPSAGAMPASDKDHRFPSVEFRNYPGYRIAIPYALAFEKEFRSADFDIIHVHTPAVIGVAGILLGKLYKKPVVGTFHTMLPDYSHYILGGLQNIKPLQKITKKLLWKYTSIFYNSCDVITAPTEDVKIMLERHGVRKKIIVMPTGIELSHRKKPKNALRKKYEFGAKDRIILHVGRVTKEKNVEAILDVMKKLKDYKLIITSDGPYMNYLQEYAKRAGMNNVIFTGFVDGNKLNDYYQLSDLFVMASKTETQGLVLVEAISYSLPIVVLDAPVISRFVKDSQIGMVVNRNGFASGIQKILRNKKLRDKFAKNSKKVLAFYDIKHCTDKLIQLYSDTVKTHHE